MKQRTRTARRYGLFTLALCLLATAGCVEEEMVEPEPTEIEDLEQISQALVTTCEYLDPAFWTPLTPAIDYARELVIRDLLVVDDPCRTTWTAGGACVGTRGRWTFGHLMTEMSGARPADRFVAQWLNTFMVGSTVNGFTVPPRAFFRPEIVEPWLAASGCARTDPIVGAGACALDLTLAPFRLLAIVNRVDLSGPVGVAGSEPGELRFVFGTFNLDTGTTHAATFILEYALPTSNDAFGWAGQFHALSGFAMGSPAYMNQLQFITDSVTSKFAEPGNPNQGSSISQLRTNEVSYGPGPDWLMREYTLQGIFFNRRTMRTTTTKQTPDNTTLFTPELDNWLSTNAALIKTLDHSVPNTHMGVNLLAGESVANFGFFWQDGTATLSPFERHMFGFATCNGCHTNETNTPFTHIFPRPAGVPAGLSGFLGTSVASTGGGIPTSVFTVTDPTGSTFDYNEPWRRVCESARLLNGEPLPYTNGAGAH